MARKKVTSMDSEREKRGLPVERWRRQGIHAVLVTRHKLGQVKQFKRRGKPDA